MIDVSNDTSEQYPKEFKIADEDNALPIINKNIMEPPAANAPQESIKKPGPTVEKYFTKIQSGTSQYIQEVNNIALDRLSSASLSDFLKPKPIINKSRSSISQQIQKALNESFAPSGADISVVSQTVGESLILHADSCYKVNETALDNKVYRGASAWISSSECGDIDEFNGQLQISLDKYLKRTTR